MSQGSVVAVASRLFEPEVSAGAFRLGSLVRGLVQAGATPHVVTSRAPRHAAPMVPISGATISRWPVLRDRGGNVRGYLQYASFDGPLLLRLLFTRFDIVVAESPPTTALVAAAVAALRRRPLVYYAADVWTDGVISMGAPAAVVRLMRAMETAVLRRARTILSVSDEVTDRLVALGAERERVATVGNGIDTSVFSPDAQPADDGRYFVYTGTMSEWQQPDVFIEAFAQIADAYPDVRLRFFGQGAVEARLRELSERLVPGRVSFGGVVAPADSARWIRGAAAALVSIVPGIGYDFARPTKTYAAAACGTPVLFAGAETGGDLVRRHGLGQAVEFRADAVADAMRELLGEAADGTTEHRREARAAWARRNVSLAVTGEKAASAVLGERSESQSGRD